MTLTPDSNTPTIRDASVRQTASRRYIISAEGDGTVIRSVPVPRPAPRLERVDAALPAETAAEDQRHLIHMRRFLRTAFDRTGR